jgi:hypothetical protein
MEKGIILYLVRAFHLCKLLDANWLETPNKIFLLLWREIDTNKFAG